MSFRREKVKDYFLLDTNIENMFINEYMAMASGDYVKVYLFAQMYAGLDIEITNEEIAKYLGLDHEDVLKAWTYWEKNGVIKKLPKEGGGKFDYDVEFVNLKEQLYGTKESTPVALGLTDGTQQVMDDKEVREMFKTIESVIGSPLSSTDMLEITSWISDYNVAPKVIAYGYEFCKKQKKTNINYVEAVIKGWHEKGLMTIEEIEKYNSERDKRLFEYNRVFAALGFRRNPTAEEKRIMDTWFDDLGVSVEKAVEACGKTSGISNPNINYVNKVLLNWHEEKNVRDKSGKRKDLTNSEITKYYEELRRSEEKEAMQHRKEVYSKVPRIEEIEKELNAGSRELSRIIISDTVDKKEVAERIKEKADMLNTEKAFLLTDNGFELDYMDVKYTCPECRDTGMLETGERCKCFGEISREKIEMMQERKTN